ncbi:restriction endonuclease subunit S [Pseudoalteromonas sp. R3]|uniref:restriction endonuclease subunit S n=1 Tax=Pseudoalteromonas sp. R3 TaxID=1709477 RepID=UPI0006B57028|nr:restriction endonuclease subunit S [Pseudoalteromonas sp. R3]AZZ98797.1 restriction endonuclease subunit S [Pseudoalteromonas sp. R3]
MSVESVITENLDIWTSAIKTKSASGRGSSNKLELYGIKKLRELILQLAVRGKLVQQDSNDEPAEKLIEKIEIIKQKLIKDKVFKKIKAKQPASEENYPHKLPRSWKFMPLTEAYYPISPGGKKLKKTEMSEEGLYPVVDQGQEFISGYTNDESVLIKIPNDVIVFGDHTRNIKLINFDFVAGADGTKILCPILIEPDFFYLSLCSFDLESRGYGRHFKILNENLLALPPLAEQSRIVTKVNEMMALCDQLESKTESSIEAHKTLVETLLATLTNAKDAEELNESWQRISEHFDTLFTTEDSIDQLKQTILQLAVMGKLVKQDPNDEPASALLERIAQEKEKLIKNKKIKKQKALLPISEDEKPFELPVGWEWSRIGNASLRTDYGLSDKSSENIDGVPVLAMGQIQEGKVILDVQKVVPSDVESLPELYLESRDLLYNRTNSAELVGKTGIYEGADSAYTYASYLIRIRTLKDNFLPEFLNLNMQTPIFRKTQIVPHLKQQCGQANVNGTIMKSMLVAIAPEAEMKRVNYKLNQLLSLCDELKLKLQAAKSTQAFLADSISLSLVN